VTAADRERFAAILGVLAETFAETLSPARAEGYFQALADLEIGEVEDAARSCMRACRYFPRPIELREALHGSAEDVAELTWARFLGGVRDIGGWDSVTFADPILHRVVLDLWGDWPAACRLESDEVPFRRQDFVRLYRLRQRQGPDTEAPAQLPGLIEQSNAAKGLREWIPVPVVVPGASPASGPAPISGPTAKVIELTQGHKR